MPGTMGLGSVSQLPWSYHGRDTWNVTLVGMGWDGKEAEWVCWEVFIGTSAVGKEMSVGCNGIWESYFVGQNCIVLAVSDGKFKEDLVRRGDLRHLRRQRVYMFNNGLERDLNDFLTCALWRKVSVIMKDVKEKGILIKRHAIFRAWITVFKIREKHCYAGSDKRDRECEIRHQRWSCKWMIFSVTKYVVVLSIVTERIREREIWNIKNSFQFLAWRRDPGGFLFLFYFFNE